MNEKQRYILSRSGQTVLILWLIMTFLFFLFRLMPGSFTSIMLFQGANPEVIAAFEEKWGLNQPLYVQYWRYLVNFLQFDAGTSVHYQKPVWEVVAPRLFNTFILVFPGITFAYVLGTIWGLLMGWKRNTRFEAYGSILAMTTGTIPAFFTSIVLVAIFAISLNIFPTSGMASTSTLTTYSGSQWWRVYLTQDFAMHYILPFTAVVLRVIFLPTTVMRTNVVEVLGQPFIQYHRLTGLPKREIIPSIGKHSILPVITMFPISQTRALGGMVLIEVVFNWPGIGFTLVQGVILRDFPLIQFVFFLVALWVVLGNFVVDLLYGVIDPRISVEN